jgi:hypothetical protein
MTRLLITLGALAASTLILPHDADAQGRGHFGGLGASGLGRGGGIGGSMRAPMVRYPVRGPAARLGGPGGFGDRGIGLQPGRIPGGMGGYRPDRIGRFDSGYRYRPGVGGPGIRLPGPYSRISGVYRPYYPRYYRRGWRYPYYGGNYRWRYPYYGGYYGGWGWDDAWGWGTAGLVAGTAIGTAVAYPVEATPAPAIGGYCATPVRTCALINPAPVATGCSCRTRNGRSRGTVVIGP